MKKAKKRVLLISVSAGAGHVRAAQALHKTAEENFPECVVEHIDMVKYASAPTRKIFFESYEKLATELPRLWGFFYNSTDIPKRRKQLDKATKLLKKFEAKKFIKKINEFAPDHIISTHFMPPDIIGQRKKLLTVKPKVSIVMTDYAIHELWLNETVDHYFVATNKMKWQLKYKGIPEQKITVSGIPVDPAFTKEYSRSSLREKHNIGPKAKVFLVLSGGQGMAGIDKIVNTLAKSKQEATLIAVAGKNQKLKKKLDTIKPPKNIKLKTLGWTDKIHEYMQLSDMVISKPGGLTVSEALAVGRPIIAIRPIPGQEEHNVEHILEHGFGVVAHSPEDLLYYFESFLKGTLDFSNKKAQTIAGQTILKNL